MAKVTNLSAFIANRQADVVGDALKGGSIEFYAGAMPDSADDAIVGQRLGVVLRFGLPAFGKAEDGVIIANALSPGLASDSINPATWARLRTAAGEPVMDVSVGTRDAVIILPTVNIPAGITLSISFFAHSVTKGL